MFHLASVSKPFVATAIVSLATAPDAGEPVLDLDAPIGVWVPELTLADGRAVGGHRPRSAEPHERPARRLGLRLARPAARRRRAQRVRAQPVGLAAAGRSPAPTFSYSNAGYELLGLVLSRVTGHDVRGRRTTTGPGAARDADSTFLRGEVPAHLAASPHVGMPLTVPDDAYPYTRRHAPSSTPALQPGRDVPVDRGPRRAGRARHGPRPAVAPGPRAARPDVAAGDRRWVSRRGRRRQALGWAVGSYRGHRTVSHSGADPGFGSRLVLVPERRTGVVVLANSNTVPTSAIAAAALDVALRSRRSGRADGRRAWPRCARCCRRSSARSPRRWRRRAGRRSGGLPPAGRGRAGRATTSTTRGSRRRCGARSSCTAPSLVWPLLRRVDHAASGVVRRPGR